MGDRIYILYSILWKNIEYKFYILSSSLVRGENEK